MNIISYKKFNISNFDVNSFLYDSEKFYLQTPIIESSGIIQHDNKNYIKLNIQDNNSNLLFLSLIKNIEYKIIEKYKDINSQLMIDLQNKYPSLKINITNLENTFYDKEKKNISISEISQNTKCVSLLYISCDYEWKLFQYMKLHG